MKYDISSLMVKVTEQHMPLWQFLVRLCGIIGGIFSTTGKWREIFANKKKKSNLKWLWFVSAGMLHNLVGFCVDVICCRFKLGVYKPKSVSSSSSFLCVAFELFRSWALILLLSLVFRWVFLMAMWTAWHLFLLRMLNTSWALLSTTLKAHFSHFSIWITTVSGFC